MVDRPQNLVEALRGMAKGYGGNVPYKWDEYPQWFRDATNDGAKGNTCAVLAALMSSAADELEQMQKLAGSLYTKLYGGS